MTDKRSTASKAVLLNLYLFFISQEFKILIIGHLLIKMVARGDIYDSVSNGLYKLMIVRGKENRLRVLNETVIERRD